MMCREIVYCPESKVDPTLAQLLLVSRLPVGVAMWYIFVDM